MAISFSKDFIIPISQGAVIGQFGSHPTKVDLGIQYKFVRSIYGYKPTNEFRFC